MKNISLLIRKFVLPALTGLCLFLPSLAFAQERHVRGQVNDTGGEPLPGATVMIEGTSIGVSVDVEGRFEIGAEPGNTLVISHIGFTDKKIRVTEQTMYEIVLENDMNFLEEVVVVGYDTQKKVNLTGSVTSVGTEEFNSRPITQVSTALQGMAPGVTVTTAGGAPGTDSGDIRIRGIGTFGGSSAAPLVLIDGVEGNMDEVDATQIDRISILKDAASSAIYGSRAANGVILITTKRGSEGQNSVTYRGYFGWSQPTTLPELVNAEEYMRLSRQASDNDGATSIYTDEYIANYRQNNYLDPDAYPITDWQERLLTGDGFTHNHTVSMTASSKKIRVMTSLGYLSQNGIIANTNYQKYNLRNNMDVHLVNGLRLRLDIAGNYYKREANPYQGSVFNFMNARDPLMLAQWSSGDYAPFTGGSTNILPMIEKGEGGNSKYDGIRFNGSASLEWTPVKWLTMEGKISPRVNLTRSHIFRDKVTYYSDAYGTVSTVSNVEHNSLTETYTLSYWGNYQFTVKAGHKFGSHDLKLLLGTSYETYDTSNLSAYRQDYAYPQYEVISAGADDEFKDNSGTRNQWALMSFFGRLNYNFKERYLFEANLRYDGSSRFAPKNRWGIFPSFSAAWRLTEEPWMQGAKKVLSEMKIRASYGVLGNQDIFSYYPTSQQLTISSISANNIIYPIVGLNSLANEDITWETSEMYDIGLDFTLWNKFSVTADWYYKTTYDILMELDIPSTIGLSAPYQNAGSVLNTGWEVGASYDDSWGDFDFGITANLSDVHNEILDMKGTYGASGVIRNQEGSSINSLYLLKCIGMVRTQEEADEINIRCPQYNTTTQPGDLIYEDYNNDGKIDDDDRQIVGSLVPRYTYGFTLNFGWKGIGLSAQFQGVGKANAYISGQYTQPCVSGGTFRKEHLDSWTADNPDASFPRLSYASDLNRKSSTFWMADASYLRLKNLQISYTLPINISKKIRAKSIMFFANATNLFTISDYYQGYDPETAYQGGEDGATTGAIGSNYPLVRTFTFGAEIKF